MTRNRTSGVAIALCVMLAAVAGCDASSEPQSPGASPAATTSAAPTTSSPTQRDECTAVLAAGSEFSSALGRFVNGQGSLSELRSATDALVAAAQTAGAAVGDTLDATLAELTTRLSAMGSALQQRPPQPAQIRDAGKQVLDSLTSLGQLCATPAPGTSP
jgi:type IV pilus biogenesis protein CpaD/CtpE